MKLYELTDAYRSVLEELSEASEDGEDETRYHDLLSGLGGAFDEKVLSIAKIIRSMEADVTVLAAEVDRLQGRKRHLAGRIDWLKRYLLGEMEAVTREKVSGPMLTVSLAKAPPSFDVICTADVPAEFQRIKVEIDRSRILEHFKQTGEVVPGTTIALDRRYVRIS